MILERRFRASRRIEVVVTPYEEFDWRWWRGPASARAGLLEVAKVAYLQLRTDDS